MSKSKWGLGVSFFFGIAVQFAPVPDAWRWGITLAAAIGVAICLIGVFLSRGGTKNGINVSAERATAGRDVTTAGRDVIVYHGPQAVAADAPHPLAVAIDEFKALRDDGDRMIGTFHVRDQTRPKANEITEFAKKAREFSRRGVFAVSPKDLAIFDRPWDEGDRLRMRAVLIDKDCFDSDEEADLFVQLWERAERVKELVEKIESK